jgi:hypothetical protein
MSTRRALNLIRRLPLTSQVSRDENGDEALWGYQEHLLAYIADVMAHLDWAFVAANSEGRQGEPPKPFPRPGQLDREIEAATQDDVKSFLAGF